MGDAYDPNLPTVYDVYLDQNNQYGHCQKKMMPYGGFEWLTPEECELDTILPIIRNIDENSLQGFILNVDLEYPEEIMDFTNCLPLAPEKLFIQGENLGRRQKEIAEACGLNTKFRDVKLAPNMMHKKNYLCLVYNLQYYLKLGMNLTKVNFGFKFNQCMILL